MIPGTGTGAGRWGWLSPDLGNALSYLLLRMWVSVGLRGCLLHDPACALLRPINSMVALSPTRQPTPDDTHTYQLFKTNHNFFYG